MTFASGDRIRMNEDALRMGLDGPRQRRTDIVYRVMERMDLAGKQVEMLRVLRDGGVTVETWAASLWEHEIIHYCVAMAKQEK